MFASQIVEKFGKIKILHERVIDEKYAEFVVYHKDLNKWTELFEKELSFTCKPAGIDPSDQESELTKEYGGIHSNQTLFIGTIDTTKVIVMFWPWSDSVQMTLKVVILDN